MAVIDNIPFDNIETIISKSIIINQFSKLFKDSPINYNFFIDNQVASDISEYISTYTVVPSIEGTLLISKAYNDICNLYKKDSSIIYNSIEEVIGE